MLISHIISTRYLYRYMSFQDGLFEAEGALGSSAASTRRRPVSAKQQRDSDAARSRPRSAGIYKSFINAMA